MGLFVEPFGHRKRLAARSASTPNFTMRRQVINPAWTILSLYDDLLFAAPAEDGQGDHRREHRHNHSTMYAPAGSRHRAGSTHSTERITRTAPEVAQQIQPTFAGAPLLQREVHPGYRRSSEQRMRERSHHQPDGRGHHRRRQVPRRWQCRRCPRSSKPEPQGPAKTRQSVSESEPVARRPVIMMSRKCRPLRLPRPAAHRRHWRSIDWC